MDSFRVGPCTLLWDPLSVAYNQTPVSVVSLLSRGPRGACSSCQRSNRLLILHIRHVFRKQKNISSKSCTSLERKDSQGNEATWFLVLQGFLSTSRSTSSCYKGKAIQLALVEASSFPTGVNWVLCMLFWTWLSLRRYLFPDPLRLQRGRQRHIQGL